MVGDAGSGGTKGLAPAPAAGDAVKFLRGDGTWQSVSVALPTGYFTGLKLEQDAGDPGNDIIVHPGAARDTGDARNLVLTVDCVKQIDVVFAEYTTPGSPSGGRSSSDNLTGAKWFHVFVIGGSGKNTQPFFATSLSPILPTGFTEWRRAGSVWWNGTNIRSFRQIGRTFYFTNPNSLDVDTSSLGTTATTYSVTTPSGLKTMAVLQVASSHASLFTGVYLSDPDATDLAPSSSAAPLASVGAGVGTLTNGEIHVMTNTSSQIRARAANSSTTLKLYAKGWIDEV